MCYLPYATSLRLSDLGYTNKSQSNLGITFNDLHSYVAGLKRAIVTPSEEFAKLGVKEGDRYLQLNSNVLQIENELYAPIRPKRVTKKRRDAVRRAAARRYRIYRSAFAGYQPVLADRRGCGAGAFPGSVPGVVRAGRCAGDEQR